MKNTMAEDTKKALIPVLTESKASDLTLEVVILLVFGIFMLLFGLLLFRISSGDLSYNPDGTYGILLVILSLQMITMGKTPFGTFRRSWILVITGICMAVVGTVACFIPGLMTEPIRELVGIICFTGGIALFLQLVIIRRKARAWLSISGIFRHLTIACGLVYVMDIIFGFVTLFSGITTDQENAVIYITFGICFFYLAWCLQKVSGIFHREFTGTRYHCPGASETQKKELNGFFFFLRDASVSTTTVIVLLLGVIFILFAIMLIPVGMGLLPFSRDSQFGLLMVIMAIQVLALGKTPLGEYNRSWPLILVGLVIVAIGIYSCIIPGLISGWMLILLGVWNLITGSIGLLRLAPKLQKLKCRNQAKTACMSPVLMKLLVTIVLLRLMTIIFGINVLVTGLIPEIIVLITLFLLGFLFMELAYILSKLAVSSKSGIPV